MKLSWDDESKRLYETGTKQAVLYPKNTTTGAYESGVAWNGLTAVSESPSGAEETALYADDIKYLSLRSAEEFGATIEAYTYPDKWAECDGSAEIGDGVYIGQQTRKGFGLCYRTTIGNDTAGNDYGYKLHLIYNAMASPSEKSYATINDSPEAITFSYELTTTPVPFPKINGRTLKPSATITIDSTKIDSDKLTQIEDMLYGTDGTYTKVVSPTGNPSTSDYYEKTGNVYVKSTDTEVDAQKDYYTASGGTDPMLPSPQQIIDILAA